jgi:FtsH-binding integral membrane protein
MNNRDLWSMGAAPLDLNTAQTGTLAKNFVSNVMTYMSAALAISGIVAWWFGSNSDLMSYLVTETGMSGLGWLVMLAPFGLVLLMGFGMQCMSSTTMLSVFIAYSVLMGMSLSFIFLAYTQSSIFTTFLITAGTFGTMAFLGYTTSTDLTKMGSFLYMALIGIIIAMVVNWFMRSAMMEYIISMIGVLVFTGLTAYDMQKIKRLGMTVDAQSEEGTKLALMGALNLYLDFVNLFLFLLRFLGNRN